MARPSPPAPPAPPGPSSAARLADRPAARRRPGVLDGDVYAYATSTASLARATGRHDVYLVLDAGIRLATFSIR